MVSAALDLVLYLFLPLAAAVAAGVILVRLIDRYWMSNNPRAALAVTIMVQISMGVAAMATYMAVDYLSRRL